MICVILILDKSDSLLLNDHVLYKKRNIKYIEQSKNFFCPILIIFNYLTLGVFLTNILKILIISLIDKIVCV